MSTQAPPERPWRIGVIGVGRIVERAHIPILAQMPDVQITGLFDPDHNRATAIAQQQGIPRVCRSLEELLDLQLDIALVACPNFAHASASIAALEADIHVVCEKPMARTSAEARAMVEAAERAGRELLIAFPNRFRPEVLALQQAIQAERLGTINAIRAGWLRQQGVPGVGTWFTRREMAGGGALVDLGSHLIDLALWLSGQHKLLSACCLTEHAGSIPDQASWYQPDLTPSEAACDVEIRASGFAVLAGPVSLFVEAGWACAVPHDRTYLHVIGTHGSAQIETLFGFSPFGVRPQHPLQLWTSGEAQPTHVTGATDLLQPYRDQWDWFLQSLRNGRSLRHLLQENIATVQIIEAMYAAADHLAAHREPSKTGG